MVTAFQVKYSNDGLACSLVNRLSNILAPLKLNPEHLPEEIANLARTVAVARISYEELEELQQPPNPKETVEMPDVSDDLLKGLQCLQNLEKYKSAQEIYFNKFAENFLNVIA